MPVLNSSRVDKVAGPPRWVECVEMPARPEFVSIVRHRLMEIVEKAGFNEEETLDIAVAVSEALSNAIEHSHAADDAIVDVRFVADGDRVTVTVKDRGTIRWDPAAVPQSPAPISAISLDEPDLDELEQAFLGGAAVDLSPRGRGLFNMRVFMDLVDINVTDTGTEVQLVKLRRPLPAD